MNAVNQVGKAADHGNAEAPCQYGGMALWAPMFHDHARQPFQVEAEKVHDRRFAGDEDQSFPGRRRPQPRPQMP